jgi:hypothetical protein
VGDADYADGGLIPEKARVEFGDGDVEGGAETVFEAARDLTLVFEGVRGFDAEFEGEESDHERSEGALGLSLRNFSVP